MKRAIKSVIDVLVARPVGWAFLDRTLLRAAGYASSIHHISHLFPDRIVRNGPFTGMKYSSMDAVGSSLYPKLLGSYEAELHPLMREICGCDYSEVVDVGCAEGYYAVGLARSLPDARVFAYDINPRARKLCASMAAANGVSSRMAVRGEFRPADLEAIPVRRKGLVICDCEGAEAGLFTDATVARFADFDLLIETHDLLDITISTRLAAVFARTHQVLSYQSVDDILKAKSYDYPELRGLDLRTRYSLLAERRLAIMEWLFLRSHSKPARRLTARGEEHGSAAVVAMG